MQATDRAVACSARGAGAARSAEDELAYQLVRVAKLLRTVRSTAPRAHWAVDGHAYPLLFNLGAEPIRISALAERTHLEVSTVSRHVASLVRDGLVQRIPDPADRRAQLVRLAPEGRVALRALQEQRQDWFSALLTDWASDDIAHLIDLLTRFGDTVEDHRNALESHHDPAAGRVSADRPRAIADTQPTAADTQSHTEQPAAPRLPKDPE